MTSTPGSTVSYVVKTYQKGHTNTRAGERNGTKPKAMQAVLPVVCELLRSTMGISLSPTNVLSAKAGI